MDITNKNINKLDCKYNNLETRGFAPPGINNSGHQIEAAEIITTTLIDRDCLLINIVVKLLAPCL